LLSLSPARAQSGQGLTDLHGLVIDENGQPAPRVEIIQHRENGTSRTVYSDAAGQFDLPGITESQVHLTISKPGFFRLDDRLVDMSAGSSEVTITLNHETEIQERLEVKSAPIQIDPDTTSHQETLVQHEILNTPVPSSHDLQQSLRVIPQVVADSTGRLHVAGARQGQTEILLDGFEINDPATGAFTSRVNVDTVREVSVETGGFGAQYAHAGGGIISLDTHSGDDKLRFGITNFIPDVSFQQGTHFGNFYPRLTFSGPLKKGKVWFSEALTLQHTFRLVTELPRGQNTDSQLASDNLLRVQVNLTPRNILQGSFLYNQLNDPRLGLGPFTALSTTTNNRSRRYFVSFKDQIWFGRALFDVGVAIDTGNSKANPLGASPYVVTPTAASGNYFQSLSQQSRRLQTIGDLTTGSLSWFGSHTLSAGWNMAGLDYSQQAVRTEIDFDRNDATASLSEIATFSGPGAFRLSNTQVGGYVQDIWRPRKHFVFSAGVRTDWDRLTHKDLVEPRIAMNWVPADDGRMKLTLAWGEHYQPLNLSVLGLGFDQIRTDQFYAPPILSNPIGPPIPYGPPVVTAFVVPLAGLEATHSYNTAAEWDERIFVHTFTGASFLLRESRNGDAWNAQPSGTLLLESNRNDRYVAGEAWIRHAFSENAQIALDYTRSRASSNQVLDPNLTQLILAAQQPGPLMWDAPDRIVSSGWTPLPIWKLLLSGFLEYHTGFPFSIVNEQQQLVGGPNSIRYPDYVSMNLGLEKRFPFRGHEWAVRLTVVNVTGHHNPDSVINNIDAGPSFLAYGGGQHRAFTARIRLVTQH
jgi:Carboxypeptidase regulatory-like domain/TonB-dependent Receptor Plug Domain/TonB dependent receptor